MPSNRKRPVTITITGLNLSDIKQQSVGQALATAINHQTDGDTDNMIIEFREA